MTTAERFRSACLSIRRACLAGLVAWLALAGTATGKEFDVRAADLRFVGDTQWTGGAWGGYHPVRTEITNFGPGRDIELRFQPHERGRGVPTVRRRVRIEQNATARLTLAVPLLGGRTSGRLDVLIDGVPQPGLQQDVTLAAFSDGEFPRASLLIVSPGLVNTSGFEATVAFGSQAAFDPAMPAGHYLSGRMAVGETRFAIVDPVMLPASWIDYSAVDLVAIPLPTLAALRPEERAALLDWVATGGRLIIHQVGAEPAASVLLNGLFAPGTTVQTDGAQNPAGAWQAARLANRRPIVVQPPDGDPSMIPNEGMPLPVPRSMLPAELGQALDQIEGMIDVAPGVHGGPTISPNWPPDPSPFAVRRVGFGRVAAMSGDAFTGNGADWMWLLDELGGAALPWPVRQGLGSGQGDMEFLNQPIPGVRGVPAVAFLTLITLFALAIGPVNYIWLWRKKQLSRLVVTVPAIAMATSMLLFAYAAIAHGFGTTGRVRSVTLIDGATNTATSISRLALFSGLAPSSGLHFSKDTAVFPLYPFQEEFIDGQVDWTEDQTLTGGWYKTRTRTQFVTVARRDERGRLTVTPNAGGLRAVNGFAVPLRYLVVTGADGRAYWGESIAAGGEAILTPLTNEHWAAVRTFAIEYMPEPPDGIEPDEITSGVWGGLPWRWYQRGWRPIFGQSLLERHLSRLIQVTPTGSETSEDAADELPSATDPAAFPADREQAARIDVAVAADVVEPLSRPRGFLAVTETNPGLDLGGLDVEERGSVHVMLGEW